MWWQPKIVRISPWPLAPERGLRPRAIKPAGPRVEELARFIRFCRHAFPDAGAGGLAPGYVRILVLLAAEPLIHARAAARKLALAEAQASRMLKRLIGLGHVERQAARAGLPQPLSLTRQGLAIATRAIRAERRRLTRRLARLSPPQQAELKTAMAKVRKLLG